MVAIEKQHLKAIEKLRKRDTAIRVKDRTRYLEISKLKTKVQELDNEIRKNNLKLRGAPER